MRVSPLPAHKFNARSDFPIEAGFLDALRRALKPQPSNSGRHPFIKLLPPNLERQDYIRIAEWAGLPARLAFFEVIRAGNAHRELACRLANAECPNLIQPIPPNWHHLMIDACTQWEVPLDSLLPMQLHRIASPSPHRVLPAMALIHDRDLGEAAYVPMDEVASYLGPGLDWHVGK